MNVFNNVAVGDRGKIQNNVSLYEGVVLEDGVPAKVVGHVDERGNIKTAFEEANGISNDGKGR